MFDLPSMHSIRMQHRAYVSSCLAKRHHPSPNNFATTVRGNPGSLINAFDCQYSLQEDGSLMRVDAKPTGPSQLYQPARPRANDKYGNMRFAGIEL